jgi:hypothetical protein
MPLLYGEAEKAFTRLQEAIMRATNDQSLFAWGVKPDMRILEPSDITILRSGLPGLSETWSRYVKDLTEVETSLDRPLLKGLFARSPKEFLHCEKINFISDWATSLTPPILTAQGILISLPILQDLGNETWSLVLLGCWKESQRILICLMVRFWGQRALGRIEDVIGVPLQNSVLNEEESVRMVIDPLMFKEESPRPPRKGTTVVINTESSGLEKFEVQCASTASWDGIDTIRIFDDQEGEHAVIRYGLNLIVIVGTFVDPQFIARKKNTFIRVFEDGSDKRAEAHLLISPATIIKQDAEFDTVSDFAYYSDPKTMLAKRRGRLNRWSREWSASPKNPAHETLPTFLLTKSIVPRTGDCKSEETLNISYVEASETA